MQVGFKTGPRTWDVAKKIVTEDGATLCEIWFQIEKADEYKEILNWLQRHNVQVGLHHWGIAPGNHKTNLMTNHADIRNTTIQQIKRTIDIAAEIKAVYVNAHPGALNLEKINFAEHSQALVPNSATPVAEAQKLLLAAAQELNTHAKEKGVVLTIETLPGAENEHYEARDNWYDPGNATLADMEMLIKAGTSIANDITHTTSSIARTSADPEYMWVELLAFTKRTQQQTRLIHLNTMVPPFDGTDTHNGFLAEDWQANAWPAHEQLIEFLTLFKDRNNVFVIPEPNKNMQENYRVLKKIVAATNNSH